VQRAPGFPCALLFFQGVASTQNSGASRRENADVYLLDAYLLFEI
jgi:hypothetical protein